MTIVASILAAGIVLQYVLNARERSHLIATYNHELAKLADRIQHPEIRQVEPGPMIEHEPPKDEAELAHIGQIVPEFVRVGETGVEDV